MTVGTKNFTFSDLFQNTLIAPYIIMSVTFLANSLIDFSISQFVQTLNMDSNLFWPYGEVDIMHGFEPCVARSSRAGAIC